MHFHVVFYAVVIFSSCRTQVLGNEAIVFSQVTDDEEEPLLRGKHRGNTTSPSVPSFDSHPTSTTTHHQDTISTKRSLFSDQSLVSKGRSIVSPKLSHTWNQGRRRRERTTSLRLDSVSLADRWNFILENSDKDIQDHKTTSFARLLQYQQQHEFNQQHREHQQHAGVGSKSKTNSEGRITLYSVSWSILLSTMTILAMTCATSLSSILYGLPNRSIQWEDISKAIPILLSSEYEVTQRIKTYIRKTCLPKGLETVHKMLLMELWRTFWLNTFRLMRKYWHYISGENYYDSLWESYAPGWLRRGVRSVFVKKVQGRLQNIIYIWMTKGWEVVSIGFGGSSWLDFEVIPDGQVLSTSETDTENSDGDSKQVFSSSDEGHEAHHEILDDVDIDLEMEFEDGALSSTVESFENDDFIEDDITAAEDDDFTHDDITAAEDDFANSDGVGACPEDEDC